MTFRRCHFAKIIYLYTTKLSVRQCQYVRQTETRTFELNRGLKKYVTGMNDNRASTAVYLKSNVDDNHSTVLILQTFFSFLTKDIFFPWRKG